MIPPIVNPYRQSNNVVDRYVKNVGDKAQKKVRDTFASGYDRYVATDPIKYMQDKGYTDQYRNEAVNALAHYAATGEMKLSPGASVYIASMSRGNDPTLYKDLSKKLNDYTGGFKSKADMDAYFNRMSNMESALSGAMQANARHLAGLGWTDTNKLNQDMAALSRNFKPGMTNTVVGSVAHALNAPNSKLGEAYITKDTLGASRGAFVNGVQNVLNGKGHGLSDYQMAQHALMYQNNPEYRAAIDQDIQYIFNNQINSNTTPEQVKAIQEKMNNGFSGGFKDNFMDSLTPEQQLQLLVANKGNASPDIQSLTNTNKTGLTNSATAGIKQGLWRSGVYMSDPRAWVQFGAEQGVLPQWSGSFAKNRELFWGTVATGAIGATWGLNTLVKGFLRSREDQPAEGVQPSGGVQPQANSGMPTTTSFWRS